MDAETFGRQQGLPEFGLYPQERAEMIQQEPFEADTLRLFNHLKQMGMAYQSLGQGSLGGTDTWNFGRLVTTYTIEYIKDLLLTLRNVTEELEEHYNSGARWCDQALDCKEKLRRANQQLTNLGIVTEELEPSRKKRRIEEAGGASKGDGGRNVGGRKKRTKKRKSKKRRRRKTRRKRK